MSTFAGPVGLILAAILFLYHTEAKTLTALTRLSSERIVFQTDFGDLELALYPDVSSSCLRGLHQLSSHQEHAVLDWFSYVYQCSDVWYSTWLAGSHCGLATWLTRSIELLIAC